MNEPIWKQLRSFVVKNVEGRANKRDFFLGGRRVLRNASKGEVYVMCIDSRYGCSTLLLFSPDERFNQVPVRYEEMQGVLYYCDSIDHHRSKYFLLYVRGFNQRRDAIGDVKEISREALRDLAYEPEPPKRPQGKSMLFSNPEEYCRLVAEAEKMGIKEGLIERVQILDSYRPYRQNHRVFLFVDTRSTNPRITFVSKCPKDCNAPTPQYADFDRADHWWTNGSIDFHPSLNSWSTNT